jgi:hypothetical protein
VVLASDSRFWESLGNPVAPWSSTADGMLGTAICERRTFRGTEDEAQVALAHPIVERADAGFELDRRRVTFGELLDLW